MKLFLISLSLVSLIGCAAPQPFYVAAPEAPAQRAAPAPAPRASATPAWIAARQLSNGAVIVLTTNRTDCPRDTYVLAVHRKDEDLKRLGCWSYAEGKIYVNFDDGDTFADDMSNFTIINPDARRAAAARGKGV